MGAHICIGIYIRSMTHHILRPVQAWKAKTPYGQQDHILSLPSNRDCYFAALMSWTLNANVILLWPSASDTNSQISKQIRAAASTPWYAPLCCAPCVCVNNGQWSAWSLNRVDMLDPPELLSWMQIVWTKERTCIYKKCKVQSIWFAITGWRAPCIEKWKVRCN